MRYCKLEEIRTLTLRIRELEGLNEKINKSRDPKRKEQFYQKLHECREAKSKLIQEDLLKGIDDLSEEEREMAHKFFYEGSTWEDAYVQAHLNTQHADKVYADESGKKEKQECDTKQKHIIRKIKQFYS